jgi:hypothetical protein
MLPVGMKLFPPLCTGPTVQWTTTPGANPFMQGYVDGKPEIAAKETNPAGLETGNDNDGQLAATDPEET